MLTQNRAIASALISEPSNIKLIDKATGKCRAYELLTMDRGYCLRLYDSTGADVQSWRAYNLLSIIYELTAHYTCIIE